MTPTVVVCLQETGSWETRFCASVHEASLMAQNLIDGGHALSVIVCRQDKALAALKALGGVEKVFAQFMPQV